MQDSSAIPVRRVYEGRSASTKNKPETADSSLPSISPSGPRKLVRPPMPPDSSSKRFPVRLSPLSSLQSPGRQANRGAVAAESSHAEAFYFQKQIHSQTLMVFVMEDGEEIEGQIEWYDRDAIKVRHGNQRTLIYKSGIKYLYKATDRSL